MQMRNLKAQKENSIYTSLENGANKIQLRVVTLYNQHCIFTLHNHQ